MITKVKLLQMNHAIWCQHTCIKAPFINDQSDILEA